jgi:transposase-like protein
VELAAEITTDGFKSYDGLVEAGFSKHHRINKYYGRDKVRFSENGVHINGIESFWSYAKRRHAKFNGLRRTSFPTFLKRPSSASTPATRTSTKSSSDPAEPTRSDAELE